MSKKHSTGSLWGAMGDREKQIRNNPNMKKTQVPPATSSDKTTVIEREQSDQTSLTIPKSANSPAANPIEVTKGSKDKEYTELRIRSANNKDNNDHCAQIETRASVLPSNPNPKKRTKYSVHDLAVSDIAQTKKIHAPKAISMTDQNTQRTKSTSSPSSNSIRVHGESATLSEHGHFTIAPCTRGDNDESDPRYRDVLREKISAIPYTKWTVYDDVAITYEMEWNYLVLNKTEKKLLSDRELFKPSEACYALFGHEKPSRKNFLNLVWITEFAFNMTPGMILYGLNSSFGLLKEPSNFVTGSKVLVRLVRFLCLPAEKPFSDLVPRHEGTDERINKQLSSCHVQFPVSKESLSAKTSVNTIYHLQTTSTKDTAKVFTWKQVNSQKRLSHDIEMISVANNNTSLFVLSLFSQMGWSWLEIGDENEIVPRLYVSPRFNMRDIDDTSRLYEVQQNNVIDVMQGNETTVSGIMGTLFGEEEITIYNENIVCCAYMIKSVHSGSAISELRSPIGSYQLKNIGGCCKTCPVQSSDLMNLYYALFGRKWSSLYEFDFDASALESQVQDSLLATVVYATILKDFQNLICTVSSDCGGLTEIFESLARTISGACDYTLRINPTYSQTQRYHVTRVMLRALCNLLAGSVSDAKIDGNGRTAAMVYAASGMKPENTTVDLLTPPKSTHVKQVCNDLMNACVPVKFIVPVHWTRVKELSQKYSREIDTEKNSGDERSVCDFIKDELLYLMQQRQYNHSIVQQSVLCELSYSTRVIDGKECRVRVYNPEKLSEVFMNKTKMHFDYVMERIKLDKHPLLWDEIKSVVKSANARTNFLNDFKTYCWYMPQTKLKYFTLLLTLFGQYVVIDVLTLTDNGGIVDETGPAFGFLKVIHALAVTNGFTAEAKALLANRATCCVRLLPMPQDSSLPVPAADAGTGSVADSAEKSSTGPEMIDDESSSHDAAGNDVKLPDMTKDRASLHFFGIFPNKRFEQSDHCTKDDMTRNYYFVLVHPTNLLMQVMCRWILRLQRNRQMNVTQQKIGMCCFRCIADLVLHYGPVLPIPVVVKKHSPLFFKYMTTDWRNEHEGFHSNIAMLIAILVFLSARAEFSYRCRGLDPRVPLKKEYAKSFRFDLVRLLSYLGNSGQVRLPKSGSSSLSHVVEEQMDLSSMFAPRLYDDKRKGEAVLDETALKPVYGVAFKNAVMNANAKMSPFGGESKPLREFCEDWFLNSNENAGEDKCWIEDELMHFDVEKNYLNFMFTVEKGRKTRREEEMTLVEYATAIVNYSFEKDDSTKIDMDAKETVAIMHLLGYVMTEIPTTKDTEETGSGRQSKRQCLEHDVIHGANDDSASSLRMVVTPPPTLKSSTLERQLPDETGYVESKVDGGDSQIPPVRNERQASKSHDDITKLGNSSPTVLTDPTSHGKDLNRVESSESSGLKIILSGTVGAASGQEKCKSDVTGLMQGTAFGEETIDTHQSDKGGKRDKGLTALLKYSAIQLEESGDDERESEGESNKDIFSSITLGGQDSQQDKGLALLDNTIELQNARDAGGVEMESENNPTQESMCLLSLLKTKTKSRMDIDQLPQIRHNLPDDIVDETGSTSGNGNQGCQHDDLRLNEVFPNEAIEQDDNDDDDDDDDREGDGNEGEGNEEESENDDNERSHDEYKNRKYPPFFDNKCSADSDDEDGELSERSENADQRENVQKLTQERDKPCQPRVGQLSNASRRKTDVLCRRNQGMKRTRRILPFRRIKPTRKKPLAAMMVTGRKTIRIAQESDSSSGEDSSQSQTQSISQEDIRMIPQKSMHTQAQSSQEQEWRVLAQQSSKSTTQSSQEQEMARVVQHSSKKLSERTSAAVRIEKSDVHNAKSTQKETFYRSGPAIMTMGKSAGEGKGNVEENGEATVTQRATKAQTEKRAAAVHGDDREEIATRTAKQTAIAASRDTDKHDEVATQIPSQTQTQMSASLREDSREKMAIQTETLASVQTTESENGYTQSDGGTPASVDSYAMPFWSCKPKAFEWICQEQVQLYERANEPKQSELDHAKKEALTNFPNEPTEWPTLAKIVLQTAIAPHIFLAFCSFERGISQMAHAAIGAQTLRALSEEELKESAQQRFKKLLARKDGDGEVECGYNGMAKIFVKECFHKMWHTLGQGKLSSALELQQVDDDSGKSEKVVPILPSWDEFLNGLLTDLQPTVMMEQFLTDTTLRDCLEDYTKDVTGDKRPRDISDDTGER